MFWHILYKFAVHFVAAAGIYVLAFVVFHYWLKTGFRYGKYIVPVMFIIPFAWLREPWDVAHGQPLIKVVTDYASWLCGCIASGVCIWLVGKWRRRDRGSR